MWSVAAAKKGFAFPAGTMDEMWKLVLLNQFHDIIPGSSIQRVYEEAEADYAKVLAAAADVTAQATAALATVSPLLIMSSSRTTDWPRNSIYGNAIVTSRSP